MSTSNRVEICSKIVKTKKDHHCYGCDRIFPKGTYMSSMSCRINFNLTTKYFCEACHHTMLLKGKSIDKFWYGELLQNALLYEKSKKIYK